jgi:hypothetical protein
MTPNRRRGRLATTAPTSVGPDQGRTLARKTLALGITSTLLFAAGFGIVPFGVDLGVAAAVASLVYAARTFRQPRQKSSSLVAVVGVTLALLTLLAFAFLILAFVFSPGD